jgi:hypothetical protein
VSRQLPHYKCNKLVRAGKIDSIFPHSNPTPAWAATLVLILPDGKPCEFPASQEWLDKHKPVIGGYFVLYEDGYQSFSPKHAFESGYSLIDSKTLLEEGWTTHNLDGKPRHPSITAVLQFFRHDHLSGRLQDISRLCAFVAGVMADNYPETPELTAGLRKLLEAKDCFVRNAL